MSSLIESAMYGLSQLFMLPVLLLVAALFFYAFYALGVFAVEARQRGRNDARGFPLQAARRADATLCVTDLEALAVKKLEMLRIASRIAPMLGLVATMIPMGPALKALADGQLQEMSRNLMVAFSAVILALLAAAITYWIVSVRRRWLATELADIEKGLVRESGRTDVPAAFDDPVAPLAAEGVQ
ncbi:MAG TPA: MotA/TolQ/ExbB proton channel family protein [Rhodocyclaceae bacterium]|nr:MotA/TolQ/ExbB proton channel family protein [Rhodocyclaceae bacterium]